MGGEMDSTGESKHTPKSDTWRIELESSTMKYFVLLTTHTQGISLAKSSITGAQTQVRLSVASRRSSECC
jgi:hypothetical protein